MVQNKKTWHWLLEGFKFELESQVRPKTVQYYCEHVKKFVEWLADEDVSDPKLLTKHEINGFFHFITTKNVHELSDGVGEEARHAESMRYHYYRGLKRFLMWLKTEGYIEQDPLDTIKFRPPKDLAIEPYSDEQKNKLFSVLDYDWKIAKTLRQRMLVARDKAILCLLLESGLRLQELTDLKDSDIDLNSQMIKVWFGKFGKSRIAGFGPQTKKALWRYMSLRPSEVQGNRFWVTEEGRPISSQGIQEIMRRLKRDAGLQNLKGLVHKLRHTFATNFLEHTGDMKACQILLGHSTLHMTQRYTQYVQADHALKYFNGSGPLDWRKS